ncbi:hypothetical protein XENTR_v10019676 [Xenopus tropicalis]|uniref:Uncharacterized protein LOC101730987 n=1 Tax=Xenopus tropicalis TaxID=8364 RepID=A0A8J1JWF3_XENTR|nr:uncharacterized protein LOC101730987 [Xenopus tropicalis]KAE8594515.1 hypothetical protein XENTR_v10019676 [Xenopus tropicalis]KAE8594516.1 hypothetical protein XENTR_v10019676 [Xenopus tropicalis]
MVRYPVQEEGSIINKMTQTKETVSGSPDLKGSFHPQPPKPKKVKNDQTEEKNDTSYRIQSDSPIRALWRRRRNPVATKAKKRANGAPRFLRGTRQGINGLFTICIFMATIGGTIGDSIGESPTVCSAQVPIPKPPLVIRRDTTGNPSESHVANQSVTCPESVPFFQSFTICYLNKTWVDISSPIGDNGTCPALYVEYTEKEQRRNPPMHVQLMPVRRKQNESIESLSQNSTIETSASKRPTEPTKRHRYILIAFVACGTAAAFVLGGFFVVLCISRSCNKRKPKTRDYDPAQTLDTQIPMNNLSNEDGPGSNGHIPGSSNGAVHGGTVEADAEPQGTALQQ